MNNKSMYQNRKIVCNSIAVFWIVFCIFFLLYKIMGYAPFGSNSLAGEDASYQYMDLFSYLKNVAYGEDNIFYSFGKALGGNSIAIFSYYLSSPFNVLVLLFDQADFHTFYDLLATLKLALAGALFSVFLNKRFTEYLTLNSHNAFVILLSISYALSQYSIAQSRNIMWLDGVYMLPLILLGVFEVVHGGPLHKLAVPTALSILFNWYTGGINCLFTIFWFVLEAALKISEDTREVKSIKSYMNILLRYGSAMGLGCLCSFILIIPTIGALRYSSRGMLDFKNLFSPMFGGIFTSSIRSYFIGALCSYGTASLFCGSLALIGAVGCFLRKDFSKTRKRILGTGVIMMILLLYWNPFRTMFSLLKKAESFWFRYSYIGIAYLLFLSALFFLTDEKEMKKVSVLKISPIFSLMLLVLNYIRPPEDMRLVYYTILTMFMIAMALEMLRKYDVCSIHKQNLIRMLLVILVLGEMTYSTKELMEYYHKGKIDKYANYVVNEREQINAITNQDTAPYRITQTSTYNMGGSGLTANYNEALAYNYWSISHYTSSPDDMQRQFLDRVGYRINGENMYIVNTSILGADSLLGVKYILSKYPINGLKEVGYGSYDEKKVYLNPFCLPMAFVYESGAYDISDDLNPFAYQNTLYSQLLGENIEIYRPVAFSVLQSGDVSTKESRIYELQLLDGDYAYYGNLPWNEEIDATLDINGYSKISYARRGSPSVFYIPVGEDDITAVISVSSDTSYNLTENQEQFYALDLELFSEVTERLKSKTADDLIIKNGYVRIEVEGGNNEKLFLSVPYDDGWVIKQNNIEITPEKFADCLITLPLQEGKNIIEMKYHAKYVPEGAILTGIGIVLLVWVSIREKNLSTTREPSIQAESQSE